MNKKKLAKVTMERYLNFVASKYFDITENNWKLDKLIPSMNDAFEICKNIEDKNV